MSQNIEQALTSDTRLDAMQDQAEVRECCDCRPRGRRSPRPGLLGPTRIIPKFHFVTDHRSPKQPDFPFERKARQMKSEVMSKSNGIYVKRSSDRCNCTELLCHRAEGRDVEIGPSPFESRAHDFCRWAI
jgi:hypothetical protein